MIGCELKRFRWEPGAWLTTPAKVHHDLFVRRHVTYGDYAPIILDMGR
jgi:hypothetical protein